jgi:E3 ubiquitin-protein ligase SHPRH
MGMLAKSNQIDCILLHAKAQSSGLNLVNATHVFLCEPLINTALELQAIARIQRIGQRKKTTVWKYVVSGTVEETIHDISTARRLEYLEGHVKGGAGASAPAVLENQLDVANSKELEIASFNKMLAKGSGGGEMVHHDDLWSCLFGHAKRSVKARGTTKANGAAQSEVDRHLRLAAVEARIARPSS